MRQCRHARRGIVVNEAYANGGDLTQHKAAQSVCDRPACIADAIARVAAVANERAVYCPDTPGRTFTRSSQGEE